MNQVTQEQILKGSIYKVLIKISTPVIAMSLFTVLYNIIDTFFIGLISGKSISGVAGPLVYVSQAFGIMALTKIGGQSLVSVSLGKKDNKKARKYSIAAIQMSFFISVIYSLILLLFQKFFIGIINIHDPEVLNHAFTYYNLIIIGFPFLFMSQTIMSLLSSEGETLRPFYFNLIATILNIILDYVFIFPMKMGVFGAALATVISQIILFLLITYYFFYKRDLFKNLNIFKKMKFKYYKEIFKIGIPELINRTLFNIFSILLMQVLTSFGDKTIGVQRIGVQIESIVWMTSFGFSSALTTFVGQNFGNKNYKRILSGYLKAMLIIFIFGSTISTLFFMFANPIFSRFVPSDQEMIRIGTNYLKILSISQLFMCIEIVSQGALFGLKRTKIAALISIIFTGLRVPASYLLVQTALGLNGVWLAISISSVIKGILSLLVFLFIAKRLIRKA